MSKVKISEVAAEAGVAISTASKALNGTGAISPDTVKRIEEAAGRLGYKPNRAAQFLAGKNKSIGIILPDEPCEVMDPMVDGLIEALDEYVNFGFRYTIRHYDRTSPKPEVFTDAFDSIKDSINGLIFIPSFDISTYREPLIKSGLPMISLQIAVDDSFCKSVTVDERMVGRMAAEFLSLFDSVRRVAMIAGDRSASIHRMNTEGFTAEADARGLSVVDILDSYDSMDNAYELTSALIERHGELDGIFVSSYVSPAVCRCLEERGLAGKIKVIGVDIFDRSAECLKRGSLSAIIYQNQREQARRSVIELISLMREGRVEDVHIKPELVLQSNMSFYI